MSSVGRFLEGRVALVTGSTGGGMGRSIALTLAAHGADIVLNHGTHRCDSEADAAAEAIVQAIYAMGSRARFVKADTRKAGEVEEMVRQAQETFGRIDILVNNAGGAWLPGDITDADPEAFRDVIEAEAFGAFLCTRACLPLMRQQAWGRIVSLGAYDAGIWADGPLSYAIGKGSRALMTRHLALQERKHNITVNLVNPGPGHTFAFGSLDVALSYARHEAAWQERQKATPQDIADAVLFLCREEARFITGSHLAFSID